MPSITKTNSLIVLNAIRNRLIDRVSLFNESNCYIDDEPIPHTADTPDWDICCSVCLSSSHFNHDQHGEVPNPCFIIEHATFLITPMMRTGMDEPKKLDYSVLHYERGLLTRIKPEIILAIMTDRRGELSRWMPTDSDGADLLLGYPELVTCTGPMRVHDWPFLGMTIHIAAQFVIDV